jgi:hypothetical protein
MPSAASQRVVARQKRLRPRAPLVLRARVMLKRRTLDGLLAAGADPSWEPELSLRAVQITGLRSRRALAEGFARAVCEAHAPPRWSCTAPLDRPAVRGAAPELRTLAAGLTLEAPVAAQGVALAAQLLRNPSSPLYLPGDTDALRVGAEIARRALD